MRGYFYVHFAQAITEEKADPPHLQEKNLIANRHPAQGSLD